MSAPLLSVYPPLEARPLLRRRPPAAFPLDRPGLRLTHLGRGGVWLALRALGLGPGRRVAMPAYHCGSEVEAARLAGLEVVFYRVDAELRVDGEDLARVAAGCDAAYLISHFGFEMAAPPAGVPAIEDAAHGLFSLDSQGRPLGARGAAAIFCPRKSLGVPDGGAVLVDPGRPPIASEAGAGGGVGRLSGQAAGEGGGVAGPDAVAPPGRAPGGRIARSSAALLAGRASLSRVGPLRAAARAVIDRSSRGDAAARQGTVTETVIGEWDLEVADMETAARLPSRLTGAVLRRSDAEAIRAVRRRHYARLRDELADHVPEAFRELPPGTCPLYLPVRAPDRAAALRRLLERGVRALEIWPVPHPLLDRERFAELEPARRELLALPVHHLLREGHVEAVVVAAREAVAG